MTQTFAQLNEGVTRSYEMMQSARDEVEGRRKRFVRTRTAFIATQSVVWTSNITLVLLGTFTILTGLSIATVAVALVLGFGFFRVMRSQMQDAQRSVDRFQGEYVDALSALQERETLALMSPNEAQKIEDDAKRVAQKALEEKYERNRLASMLPWEVEAEARKQSDARMRSQREAHGKTMADAYRRKVAEQNARDVGTGDERFENEWRTHKFLHPDMQYPQFERAVLYAKYQDALTRVKTPVVIQPKPTGVFIPEDNGVWYRDATTNALRWRYYDETLNW